MKLRPESLIKISSLLLAQEDELPPELVIELKNFQKGHVAVRSSSIDWENDPRPYIKLAASVASDIIRGDLSPGDQIPSRVSLARKYGVSAPTASKAVRLLASIGAAELDGNAYWVSNRVPAALLKEEKATTPLHRRERPLPRCLISVIHDPRRLIRCQRKDAMTNRSNEVLHPVSQMTTFELTDLRGTLEDRLAMPTLPPGSLPRGKLQQQLSEVIAEQDDRTRIRRAGTHA